MDKVIRVKGIGLPFAYDNVDTDQIIPAEFLKITKREGLGEHLFNNWRYLENGEPNPHFILNDKKYRGANILIAGRNFGIGSSREHAVWALMDYGFKAIIAASFGDIFYENAAKNGLVCAIVDDEGELDALRSVAFDKPIDFEVNVERLVITYADKVLHFRMDRATQNRLLTGLDDIEYTLKFYLQRIREYEMGRPVYMAPRKVELKELEKTVGWK
ncbi:MAG: 3-isopropylmalate dehydratase small subunit [Thermoprotei archaeon]